ncbi:hypothetical protein [Methylocaldum gracile]|uniref:hypothetical protein n=1 Tax=unclassified Methylocaldum TaxID=2622260 RepID=UPI0014150746
MSYLNLEAAVGRARVCGRRTDSKARRRGGVFSREEEQRRQPVRLPCNRVRSGVTQTVT